MTAESRIIDHLTFLYGNSEAQHLWTTLDKRLEEYKYRKRQNTGIPSEDDLSQKDVILITYGDQLQSAGQPPLQTLSAFYIQYLQDIVSAIHLLPFFPYSSDDGFSVIDYRQVNPQLGTWVDINHLGQSCDLMFDAVINHVSSQSDWFQGFLKGNDAFQNYFIPVDPGTDLSAVVRPRALPLLTPFESCQGTRHLWTTFSTDQIDLNFSNPQVLLEIIDILLLYVERGARFIRLDAIAYLWKEIGTPCIHLPQTHSVIKLMRAVLDLVAPGVILITETNVPHEENISYFGELLAGHEGAEASRRGDEAQMVYQFPLAPLVLHTFLTGDATRLNEWACCLKVPFPSATFLNFIASHDGIGVRPVEGILTPAEIQTLVESALAHGGKVSYKTNSDGSQSAYELNISLYDALNDPQNVRDELDVRRFLASQAIMLSLAGVPGIYFHSLFGSRNDQEGFKRTGRARSLNREKFARADLSAKLANPASRTAQVFSGYAQMLKVRRQHSAFHPAGNQKVLFLDKRIFGLRRTAPDESEDVLCLINVSDQACTLPASAIADFQSASSFRDLLSGMEFTPIDTHIKLQPYQVMWLKG